jgi:Anti-sigma factor NepR
VLKAAAAQAHCEARGTTMAENIYVLPETCGPMLREYYSKLLQEPIPQQLKDLLSMLEAAAAEADAATASNAHVRDQASPQEPRRDPDESK